MRALLEAMDRSMPPLFKDLPRALTRHLIGGSYADMLDVPKAGLMGVAVEVLRPLARALTPLTRVGPFGELANTATRKMYGFWIRTRRGERPRWRFEWARQNWSIDHTRVADAEAASAPYST